MKPTISWRLCSIPRVIFREIVLTAVYSSATVLQKGVVLMGKWLTLSTMLFLLSFLPARQETDNQCVALVNQAFASLAANCPDVASNQACYGFQQVRLTPDDKLVFNKSGARADLSSITKLQTGALNLSSNQWGISLLHVQGSLPTSLPGAVYLLMGDVQLENRVSRESAFTPAAPFQVAAVVGANVRAEPNPNGRIIGSVAAGTMHDADAKSVDGRWLRVVFGNAPGWMSMQVARADGDLAALPVLQPESFSPAQNFCLRGNTDLSDCGIPSLLLLQAPDNLPIIVRANGVDIRVTDTTALRLLPEQNMRLLVLAGTARFGAQIIPAGFTASLHLNADGCSPSEATPEIYPMTAQEIASLQSLEGLNAPILYRAVGIPSQADIQVVSRDFFGVVYGPAAGQIPCARLRPLSPLDRAPYGQTSFFWDKVLAADTYRLKIYDAQGALLGTYDTNINNGNITVDMAAPGFGDGSAFAWEVDALLRGQLACTSKRVSFLRDAPQPQPVANPANNGNNQPSSPGKLPTATFPVQATTTPSNPGTLPTASLPPATPPPP
jgi:hypothetical protein